MAGASPQIRAIAVRPPSLAAIASIVMGSVMPGSLVNRTSFVKRKVWPSERRLFHPRYLSGMVTGRKLREARTAKGFKLTEAAALLSISKGHLSGLETDNGKGGASLDLLLRMARLYECDLAQLGYEEEDVEAREVAISADEVEWLRAFRSMRPDERSGALAMIRRNR